MRAGDDKGPRAGQGSGNGGFARPAVSPRTKGAGQCWRGRDPGPGQETEQRVWGGWSRSATTRLPCAARAHGLSPLRLPAGTPTARSLRPHADMCTGQAGGRGRGARAAELTARRQSERGSRGRPLTLGLREELSTQPQVSPGGCQVPLPSRALPHAGSARVARQPFPKRQTCTAGAWLQRQASVFLSNTTTAKRMPRHMSAHLQDSRSQEAQLPRAPLATRSSAPTAGCVHGARGCWA